MDVGLNRKEEGRYDGARGDYDFSPQDVQTVKGSEQGIRGEQRIKRRYPKGRI